MKKLLVNLFFAGALLALNACRDDAESPPPRPPVFVPKSSDTARAIRGIQPSAIREAPRGGLRLEWFQNRERNLGGYEVWRTEQTRDGAPVNFSLRQRLPLGSQAAQNLPDTVFIDEAVQSGVMYYYRLIAYSRLDVASEFSADFQQYELRRTFIADSPRGDITMPSDSTLVFRWLDNNESQGPCCLKIYVDDLDFREENCVAIATKQSFFANDSIRIDFRRIQTNFPGTIGTKVFKKLERGKRYFWFVMAHPSSFDAFVGAPSTRQTFFIAP